MEKAYRLPATTVSELLGELQLAYANASLPQKHRRLLGCLGGRGAALSSSCAAFPSAPAARGKPRQHSILGPGPSLVAALARQYKRHPAQNPVSNTANKCPKRQSHLGLPPTWGLREPSPPEVYNFGVNRLALANFRSGEADLSTEKHPSALIGSFTVLPRGTGRVVTVV